MDLVAANDALAGNYGFNIQYVTREYEKYLFTHLTKVLRVPGSSVTNDATYAEGAFL